MDSIIKTVHLSRTYQNGQERITALKDCSIQIERGSFTAIIGTSGSGKSTLLNILGGLDVAATGEVLYENNNILKMSDDDLSEFRLKHIGFIFQSFNLIPELTVEENILLPLIMTHTKCESSDYQKLVRKLKIDDRMKHTPDQLSGGQQQRVAIARALVMNTQILLCDEPTGNLDSNTSCEVIELLVQLQKDKNLTIIMVTHDSNIANHADRIIQIEDGTVIQG